jgi:hypothetical protein
MSIVSRAARPAPSFRHGVLTLALTAALGGFAMPATALADTATPVASPAASAVDIAYQQFTLPNGLQVIVHEDHKAPIVAVNLWYHVGSKDEPAGRSGFAHLY